MTLPTFFVGGVFLATLPIGVLRFWMVGQGWGAVRVHELKTLAFVFPDPDHRSDDATAMPLALQEALAEAIHHKGWLAWSEVMDLAQAHGVGMAVEKWFAGGGSGPIARRKDWKEILKSHAWHSGQMVRALGEASPLPLPARGRL